MAKLTLTDIANISGNPTSAEANINANSAAIEAALENTLSRDGSTPNTMNAALDMNSNRILNVPSPVNAGDIVPKSYIDGLVGSVATVYTAPTNGVARTFTSKLSDVVHVADYGAVGDGTTDDLAALQNAWARIVAVGGGTLVFGNNKTYKITSVAFGSLFDCNGLKGVTVEGNGSQISMGAFTGTANIFLAQNVQGLAVQNLRATATTTNQITSTSKGYRFCYATNASQLLFENCEWQIALAGIMCAGNYAGLTPTQGPVTGVTVLNAYSFETYYPFNFQAAGDNVVIRARTIKSGRAYFPWNVRDHDVQIYSEHGGPFDDVLLKAYCDSRHSYNKLENIKLRYSTSGRYATAQTQQTDAALIAIDVQQFAAGFETAGQISNIDIEILASNLTGVAPSRLLIVRRQDAAGAGDTSVRNHVFIGWKISGRVNSAQTFTQTNVIDIFSTINSYTWTNDYAANFKFDNLQGSGLTTQTLLRINGVPFNNAGRCVLLDNVTTDMQINWDNYPTSGNVVYTNVYAQNYAKGTFLKTLVVNGATPTSGTGELALGATVASTVGAAGGASALPATPLGYIVASLSGTTVKIPYFNN